eukprot:828387_1
MLNPPLKKRKLYNNLSEPMYNNIHPNDTNNNSIEEFKSQLTELLELFPPFIDIITLQNNPQTQLSQLFEVFSSNNNNIECYPSLSSMDQFNSSSLTHQSHIQLQPPTPIPLPLPDTLNEPISIDQHGQDLDLFNENTQHLDLYLNRSIPELALFDKAKIRMIKLLKKNLDYR